MGKMIRMTMDDGAEIAVYHVEPEGERRGGLVLVQEIFGVTDHIRELCDEYAADGYEVLSPSIFDREHPGFEAEYTGPDYERAVQLARELHPFVKSLDDAQVCIDALKDKGPVFITGYCYGGSVAWAMAGISDDLAAASCCRMRKRATSSTTAPTTSPPWKPWRKPWSPNSAPWADRSRSAHFTVRMTLPTVSGESSN